MSNFGSLIEVEECRTEEEQRREHEIGEERCNALGGVRLSSQEEQQHHARDEVDDGDGAACKRDPPLGPRGQACLNRRRRARVDGKSERDRCA